MSRYDSTSPCEQCGNPSLDCSCYLVVTERGNYRGYTLDNIDDYLGVTYSLWSSEDRAMADYLALSYDLAMIEAAERRLFNE